MRAKLCRSESRQLFQTGRLRFRLHTSKGESNQSPKRHTSRFRRPLALMLALALSALAHADDCLLDAATAQGTADNGLANAATAQGTVDLARSEAAAAQASADQALSDNPGNAAAAAAAQSPADPARREAAAAQGTAKTGILTLPRASLDCVERKPR